MMRELRFTLVSEGSSDRALIPILLWALRQHSSRVIQPQWAELRRLPKPPGNLEEKVRTALLLHPCDLLFIHRDADRAGREKRVTEIAEALEKNPGQPAVCVVPIRTQEAWFLFAEHAIRRAAGNPNGKTPLNIPSPGKVENIPDPKQRLHDLLRDATGLSARKRRGFRSGQAFHRIAELIEDFSPLRELAAFQAFETDLCRLLADHSWSS